MVVPPLTYVRHAMAVPADGVHPTEWHLDDVGRTAARAGASRLEVGTGIGRLVSSTEPKAMETAEAIAEHWSTELVGDERLREAVRPWIGPGYRAIVHRYLRGEPQEGWEPHAEVAARVGVAVADATAAADGGPVVVVSHGLALAVHLGDRLGAEFDCESFWSGLAFPDAWALDADDVLHRSLVRSPIT
ncbi:MAG: histidine phosphatase family protein [Acidimicrobiales bacterium]